MVQEPCPQATLGVPTEARLRKGFEINGIEHDHPAKQRVGRPLQIDCAVSQMAGS